MTTNGRRAGVACCGRAAMLAAMWTALVWTCCADAAATAESNDWRPCRAAGHRRYDEVVHRNNGHGGAGYEDFTGGSSENDDGGGEAEADDDYNDDGDAGGSDEGYLRLPVDDKPKRGAVKQYEKKPDLHRPAVPASYAVDGASANGMRVDTTLLRGETIELPTYVNVPVTLKCRFEPVDGTVDKFDTVVEAMYPGHRDAPPPPPSSHASRILKQLMGSVEGWRGVTHNSGRSVRRASGNRFGRRELPARGDEEVSDGLPTAQRDGYDQVAWNIIARQRAAERMRRIHDSRKDFYWPEWFQEQSARLLQQRIDGHPVAVRKQSENQLIEDEQAEQDVYDQQVDGQQAEPALEQLRVDDTQVQHGYGQQADGQQAEQVYDQQVDGQQAEPALEQLQVDDTQVQHGYGQQVDGRQAEQGYGRQLEPHIYDLKQVESVDDSQQVESIDDSQQVESVDDSQQVESVDDSQQVENVDDSQQVERVNDQRQLDGRQVERVEDRAAAEEVDDRQVLGGSLPADDQQLQRDVKSTTSPETATAVISDSEKFRKGIPVRTYVEYAYTTDSAL